MPRTGTKRAAANLSRKHAPTTPLAPAEFHDRFLANLLPDDLAALTRAERQQLTAYMWQLAGTRRRGTVSVRLYNPTKELNGWTVDHTVLEIVSDDMPFLVDSVTCELQRRGLTVHLFIHPVMNFTRDARHHIDALLEARAPQPGHAESLMHVQFDQCPDQKTLNDIAASLRAIFGELYVSVEDWPKMRQRMSEAAAEVMISPGTKIPEDDIEETRVFLNWLSDNNFIYLGYRRLDLLKTAQRLRWKVDAESGLGLLRDEATRMFGGLRDIDRQPKEVQDYLQQPRSIIVTKSNERSRIHRTVPMDAIFIQRFDDHGKVVGEHLFIGLFTSRSYSQSPSDVPFVRHKIKQVAARAHFDPLGHDGKALIHILEHYPRDELFQIGTDDLFHHSVGIVQLQERSRTALFVRRDPFGRFVTCLVYIPREHYDSTLRLRLQRHLSKAFGGVITDYNIRVDDSPLARVFLTVSRDAGAKMPDLAKLENEIRELSRTWSDRLRDSLVATRGEANALNLLRRYGEAFPPAYCDVVSPADAVADIEAIERAEVDASSVVDFSAADRDGLVHLKLFQPAAPLVLSDVLPLIENMGLKVEYMGGPFEITPQGSIGKYFIHEFACRPAKPITGNAGAVKLLFQEAFALIWKGDVENDTLNALTLCAGLPWREILMLRALTRYLRQLRIPYSPEMLAATLLAYPEITRNLAALFVARFVPDFGGNRNRAMNLLTDRITTALADVQLVEQDRALRRYLNLIHCALRTNYFQTDASGNPKPYLSIKFNSRAIDYMPLPKPLVEIFVYSPRVEAVHLRGGKVARGGIRWSDRREDFRNEILGLMKAQMVKNCVIVPVGSKGGFIVKRPPAEADKFYAEGVECYRIMMRGLLDITDNRVGEKIVPPPSVARHDGDDPYLVVAADKGTAKFSDIANAMSQEYKFWLDDAFASGGSAGYDHKDMGITARGAWEAVKRHFRELGTDIQATDFTVVGVGDMSGDVFGNAMLLSRHIQLLGAFDHRHIFLDPNPDAAKSFAERQRMYKLPRSSWADYDAKKISKGGGVFSRNDKSIKLTPEIRKAFGVTGDTIAPSEMMQAMLKASVDLLYFGGIGTYVKASEESHEDASDRANDALRVDAGQIRALVMGEGANLGMTQRARIEYALKGGRLNTDAIDNSAGVDTSDHEVNIKILFRKAVLTGKLPLKARDKLLASMTDEVARLVLRDNYLQTQALSLAESQAPELLPLHARSIRLLEKTGLLNRAVEFLPDEAEIAERQQAGKGLTRPELAVLLAYAKIWLYDELLASDLPDDPFMKKDLRYYFPIQLQDKYRDAIEHHQLRREITATVLTNSLVNRIGSHFPFIVAERTGRDAAEVARAYLLVRASYNMHKLREQIEELDNTVPATTQTAMLLALNKVTNYVVPWFLTQSDFPRSLIPAITYYREAVARLAAWLEKSPPEITGQNSQREDDFIKQGVPASLARRLSIMPYLATAPDIAQLAEKAHGSIELAAATFFGLGHRLGLDWLRKKAEGFAAGTPWQREATGTILDDLFADQRSLAVIVLGKQKATKTPRAADGTLLITTWAAKHAAALESYDALLAEFRLAPAVDLAMLTLASRQLSALLK